MTKARDTSNLVSSQTGIAVTITGDPVVLGVGNTELVTITGGGNIGINSTQPNSKFVIGDNLGSGYVLTAHSDTIYGVNIRTKDATPTNAAALWVSRLDGSTNSSLFRVQNDGKIGIGTTTTPGATLDILSSDTPQIQTKSNSASEFHLYTANTSSGTADNVIRAYKSRGTLSSPQAVLTGDIICRPMVGYAYDGTSYSGSAYIEYGVDGTVTTNNVPTRIKFWNRLNDGTLSDRVCINTDGSLGIGSTAAKVANTAIVANGHIDIDRGNQGANPRLYMSHDLLSTSYIEVSRVTRELVIHNNNSSNIIVGGGKTVNMPHSLTVGISSSFAWQSGMTSARPTAAFGTNSDSSGTNGLVIIKGYDGKSPVLALQSTSGAGNDSPYATTADTTPLGVLSFEGVNSSGVPYPAASIRSTQIATAGGYVAGDIRFHVSRNNDGLQEIARISSNNNTVRTFLMGYTTINFAETLVVRPNYNGASTNYAIAVSCTGTSNIAVRFANDNGVVGSITMAGSATAYNTSSDYRLKENVSSITGALERLMQLNPIRFNWISDETNTQIDGFLAHEVSPVVPESINGTKDEMNTEENVLILDNKIHSLGITSESWNAIQNDPNRNYEEYPEDVEWRSSFTEPKYQGIDQSKLVPLLTAALKELTVKVNALEAAVGIAST